MSTVTKETVWLERGNIVEWVVTADGVPVTDLSGLTRAIVCINGIEADSDIEGSDVIWWTDSVTDKTLCDGTTYTGDVLRAKLGLVSTFSAGEYSDCRLIIYDSTYTNGLVVSDDLFITVLAACS